MLTPKDAGFQYVYGPVPSRRLGLSLGIDIIPQKKCTFDCLYCQVGRTPKKTTKRFNYVNIGKLKGELSRVVKTNPKINFVTISGSGEPTLHNRLDKIITAIKIVMGKKMPICVITNGSLLYRADVREELMGASVVMPSLDGASPKTFKKVNAPHKSMDYYRIFDGLVKFNKEFKGKLWLEIMLIAGINDSIAEAERFVELIDKIVPDRVYINLPVRPAARKIRLSDKETVTAFMKVLGKRARLIASTSPVERTVEVTDCQSKISDYIKRRPAKTSDLLSVFKMPADELRECLKQMECAGLIVKKISANEEYYTYND